MFDPWRTLRALTHVTLIWTALIGRYGYTNGVDLIYMHPVQLQVERRCTLTHELVHLERRHTGPCHQVAERAVRTETARRLIAFEQLVDAFRWSMSLEEAADELHVTLPVLMDRLARLQPDEVQTLGNVILARGDGA